eukprot:Sro21_g014560.1 cross-link repair 1A protein (670) ;mRNA; r:41431-43440
MPLQTEPSAPSEEDKEETHAISAEDEQPVIFEIDDDDDDDDDNQSGQSEGYDDVYCTQMYDDDDDDQDQDPQVDESEETQDQEDTNDAALPCNTSTNFKRSDQQKEPKMKNTGKTPQPGDDVCIICGSSFDRITTGFQGRLNHIKRCAKKHGVQAQDMKLNHDDNDDLQDNCKKAPAKINPYAKQTSNNSDNNNTTETYNNTQHTWHAGADRDLQLATGTFTTSTSTNTKSNKTPSAAPAAAASKQTSLTSYFKAPLRSLNNVLLASAKNAAKTSKLNKQQKQQQQQTANNNSKKARWNSRQNYVKKTCPAYKRITGTDFICDGFTYAKPSLSQTYFLTHFHSDHYGGITRTWQAGVIYCSLPTANLVHERLGVDRHYLHPLALNTPTVIATSAGRPVTVTLLDANHCPGAVMFLFQVGKRTILHVGDFRWHRAQMLPPLQRVLQQLPVDELFLDTTYCQERYTLPTQQAAIQATVEKAVQEVQRARAAKERLLLLFGAYTIGKERIYLAVAERLGVKVYVDSQRYKVLVAALEWPADKMQRLLTTKRNESNLWVVELGHINMKRLPPYLYACSQAKHPVAKFDRVVGFRPTGWSNRPNNNHNLLTTATTGKLTVHSVPYSEHSSFPELVDCIRALRPKKIVPTVSVSKSQQQVDLLLRHVRMRQTTLA